MEIQRIIDRLAEIERLIADLKDILGSEERQRGIVGSELQEITDKYGDERRTRIVAADGDFSEEDFIADEDVVVTITHGGYAKRTRADQYRVQKRGGKGVRGATLRADDEVAHLFKATNHEWLLFFTNLGRVYRAKIWQLPEAGRDAKGGHVAGLLSFLPDEHIAQVMTLRSYEDAPYLVLATRKGFVKKTALPAYDSPRQAGVIAINFREEGDELIGAALCSAEDDVLLISRKGQAIRFQASDEQLRPMGRATSGVTGMRFRGDDVRQLGGDPGGLDLRQQAQHDLQQPGGGGGELLGPGGLLGEHHEQRPDQGQAAAVGDDRQHLSHLERCPDEMPGGVAELVRQLP